ncbi:hypothetical protein ECANGB1_16 [Enterospora canceri]|uniref:Uncharacterized protein n=1 Tax=Enterospora canceri TaxID=1081671 RepID=A0A1Y1S4Q8_9MICR|nr:hypothetical protein ECANGB1_16 [Enterospora canceri]
MYEYTIMINTARIILKEGVLKRKTYSFLCSKQKLLNKCREAKITHARLQPSHSIPENTEEITNLERLKYHQVDKT